METWAESWHKIVVPLGVDDPEWTYNLMALAGSIYKAARHPAEFWVYQRNDDSQSPPRSELYFSPNATRLCSELLAPLQSVDCGVPVLDDTFKLRAGDDSDLQSWLKKLRTS